MHDNTFFGGVTRIFGVAGHIVVVGGDVGGNDAGGDDAGGDDAGGDDAGGDDAGGNDVCGNNTGDDFGVDDVVKNVEGNCCNKSFIKLTCTPQCLVFNSLIL